MGVTAFRQFVNSSSRIISLYNHETRSDSITLQPGTSAGIEMWIPWCTSTTDFKNLHRISVTRKTNDPIYDIVLYSIWQKDNQVCYSNDGAYHSVADPIPGVCAINGDRILTVNADLSIVVSRV